MCVCVELEPTCCLIRVLCRRLMYHMQQHAATMTNNEEMDNRCPHCFRHFSSPFKLQCHLETVHSQQKSTGVCSAWRIQVCTGVSVTCVRVCFLPQ